MGECPFCGKKSADKDAEYLLQLHDELKRLRNLESAVSGLLDTTKWWDMGLYHNDLVKMFSKHLDKANPQ